MRPKIEFTECLKDSPRFRASLEEAESDVDLLEMRLEKLVKLCNNMIDAGKMFNNANSAFIGGVRDVALHFKDEDLVSNSLSKFSHVLSELQKYNNMLLDQANRSICKNLQNFVKTEIKKVKETRKHFEKISDDLDNAFVRNAQVQRSKPHECEEIHNVLTATKSCFTHVSLDYVFQIYVLHAKKRFDILDTMLAYMHAQSTYFHQGSDLFEDLEQYKKHVAAQLEELSSKSSSEQREMEQRHAQVQQKGLDAVTADLLSAKGVEDGEDPDASNMQGYLFKRTSNAFKTWVRRWFSIDNHQLVYRKRSRDNITVMEEDLRLCTVKPVLETERRFCFEVVSPSRSHVLQADSEQECSKWILAIQNAVSFAYNSHTSAPDSTAYQSPPKLTVPEANSDDMSISSGETDSFNKPSPSSNKSPSLMATILSLPGNDKCCDCGSPDPRWASANLGITLCIECSGIHRSFGVHMSKVKSLTLDSWEPELRKVMAELGNTVVNRVYEYNVNESVASRATPQCNREAREAWIRAKYIDKSFVRPLPESVQSSEGRSGASPAKRWSVMKHKRRSPSKEKIVDNTELTSIEEGTGGSPDVIVFGSGTDTNDRALDALGLVDSDDSSTDTEADMRSTTSYEELGRLQPDLLLYRAAEARNLPVMIEALALKANPNWQNENEHSMTPLIKAVYSGSMAPTELLLLNGAKVDRKDNRAQTALHHAVMQGNTGQVCQFLKRNANQHAVDENGHDPLALAITLANADIVTLLRLSKLNEEMKDADMYGPADETFNEVFRDFTNMANNTPEKLNRNK